MKMVLNAPAVAKLVELDPEGTIELAKGAAAQVAQEIAQRLSREAITQHSQSFVEQDMVAGGWYQKQIAPKYQQLLQATMQQMANQFIQDLNSGAIRQAIDQHVTAIITARIAEIEQQMRDQADRVLRERFAIMFAAPPTSI